MKEITRMMAPYRLQLIEPRNPAFITLVYKSFSIKQRCDYGCYYLHTFVVL